MKLKLSLFADTFSADVEPGQGYEEVHVKPFKHPDVNPEDLIPLLGTKKIGKVVKD